MIYKLYELYSRLTVCCSEIQKHEELEGKGEEVKGRTRIAVMHLKKV